MASVNKAIIVGNLGRDPELRQTSSGTSFCTFTVATNEQWRDNSGETQERTEWHRIVVWGRQAETCSRYLSKGRQAYIEGRLQTREWTDQEGQKRNTTEIVAQTVQFLGGRDGGGGGGWNEPPPPGDSNRPSDFGDGPSDAPPRDEHGDDDIPF